MTERMVRAIYWRKRKSDPLTASQHRRALIVGNSYQAETCRNLTPELYEKQEKTFSEQVNARAKINLNRGNEQERFLNLLTLSSRCATYDGSEASPTAPTLSVVG
jgi:hypothetical protein